MTDQIRFGIPPFNRRRSVMVRMNLHQSVGNEYFQIQLNPGNPHFIGLNEVLARIPFRDPEIRRFVDFVELHNTDEEIEDGWGSDEPVSLITDEDSEGEEYQGPLSSQDEDGGGNGNDLSEGDSDEDILSSVIIEDVPWHTLSSHRN